MKKLITMFLIVVITAMVFSVIGCKSEPTVVMDTEASQEDAAEEEANVEEATEEEVNVEEAAEEEADRSFKVGVSVLNVGNTLYIDVINGIKSKFNEDVDIITVVDAQDDATKQAEQVENLAAAGYDGIIILPADPVALSPACKEAREKGTKILTWVTKLEEGAYDSHIVSDAYTYGGFLGKYTGQWIKDHWADEEVVEVGMLTYSTIPEVIPRQEGMEQEMIKIAPNAKVVAYKDAGAPEEGLTAAENFLQAFPDMKVIYGINDGGAVGAYEAVIAAGRDTEDFFVGGTDGIQQALELIKEGGIYRCTVSINPFNIGEKCADNLKNMVLGNEYWEEDVYDLKLVTPENVDEFLK